jgi:hypothetical protein
MLTIPPETVQTPPVVEAKVTGSPELAVALTGNVPDGEYVYDVTLGLKVMVCAAGFTVSTTVDDEAV